ncbi:hypothetical protein ACEPAH_568 [Sanghuangporus vaninii]
MHPYANPSATTRSQQAAQALASVLTNPYQHSSHYAQAYYTQQQESSSSNGPLTTPEGYSLSSTYAPYVPTQPQQFSPGAQIQRGRGHGRQQLRGGGNTFHNQGGHHYPQPTHWYEPGNYRCTHEQCSFTGSKKSVEIHMMDRHLIYPPGWEKRKRRVDWDADPSLRGKKIPIQGTNVILDAPEAIDAWIAERKKRWPTATRVEEKGKKLKDALERGEISASDPSLRGRKRPRQDDNGGRTHLRGWGRGRGVGGSRGRPQPPRTATVHPLPMKPVAVAPLRAHESDDESSTSGSDMDPEKDAISSKPPPGHDAIIEEEISSEKVEEVEATKNASPQVMEPIARKSVRYPKAPPSQRNPFANRSSLLRNLLLPEIRMTVSNLSQAIHFLVENDFLEDVELNPGDADNKPIEVISETTHDTV